MFKATTLFLTIMLALFTAPAAALAAHPLVTDDAGTEGSGNFLLEINAEVSHDDEAGVEERGGELAISLAAGLRDNLDLVVGIPYAWYETEEGGVATSDEDGISDASLELKWRFFERDGLSIALKPGVTFPTGDEERGLGNGEASYSLALILTREFERWALHTNLSYTRNEFKLQADEDSSRHDIWHASVAAEAGVTESLTVVGNIGIETNPDRASDTHPAFALAGLIYSLNDSVSLDAGVKAGLNSTETDIAVLTGMAISF